MLKAVIIEDEIRSVNVILQLLSEYASSTIQVLGVSDTISGGKELIESKKPDIVFMDIELRDGNSFSILEQLPKIDFKLIFITAFDKFAVEAFRFSAIDYLLKPIDNRLFEEVIKRIIQTENSTTSEQQFHFLREIKEHKVLEKVNKIALIDNKDIFFEPLDNIISLKARESYTEFQTNGDKKYTMSKNLGYYHELLHQHANFIRIHYSTIININFIKRITQNSHNKQYKVELNNGAIFEVSQRRVSEFKKFIKI